MLDTLGVVKELAQLTTSHTHKDTGAPLNKDAISGAGGKSDNLKDKYTPVIG